MLPSMAQEEEQGAKVRMIAVELPHAVYVRLMTHKSEVGKPTKRLVAEWVEERLAIEEAKLAQQ